MRFVADETCDFAVVRALRSAGHEVLAVAEISPRISDKEVLRLASNEERILLTEDTDFGELVHAEGLRNSGLCCFDSQRVLAEQSGRPRLMSWIG